MLSEWNRKLLELFSSEHNSNHQGSMVAITGGPGVAVQLYVDVLYFTFCVQRKTIRQCWDLCTNVLHLTDRRESVEAIPFVN